MKTRLISIITILAAFVFTTGFAAAQGQYVSGTTGVDASWPNCSTSVPKVAFGIVGVNGGTAFTQNACLQSEASHFGNLSFYVNTAYPGASSANAQASMNSPRVCSASDLNCIAYDYGYNAGQYAANYALAQNQKVTTTWWLDAETSNSWTSDTAQNQNSLLGEHDALIDAGALDVGVYSTTAQWGSITGSWQNDWPSWGATTWTTAKQAATYCHGHEFTGGPSYLMQFKAKHGGLDQDYAC